MDPVETYWFHFPWTSTAGFHVSVQPPKLCGGINVDSIQPTRSTEAQKQKRNCAPKQIWEPARNIKHRQRIKRRFKHMDEVKVFLRTWGKLVVGRGIPLAGQNHHTFLRGPGSDAHPCRRRTAVKLASGWWDDEEEEEEGGRGFFS